MGQAGQHRGMDVVSVPLALNGFHVLTFSQSGNRSGDHVSPGNKHNYVEMMLGSTMRCDLFCSNPI